ncbi:hypothetical protein AHiyo6_27620 [Arthrobacter sp. Hiyo6]|nr:hypothetical protein AHiyo6_27620 [Arthrobacter sp. Hiyo6]
MVVAKPHGGVLEYVLTHGVGAGAVQVDRVTPRVAFPGLKIGTEPGQVISAGTQMVVDHVLDDAQAGGVRGVDEALVGGWAAIASWTVYQSTPS